MPYTVTCFRSWSTQPTWESLSQWLQSAEGGYLRVVEPRNSSYAIVRYVKDKSDFSLEHTKWCRSVVVNKETRRVVCVSPPKGVSVSDDTPITQAITAEEFLDGTMMNVFQDQTSVQSATRSRIGGGGRFYKLGKSFDEMCMEALVINGHTSYTDILPPRTDTHVSVFTSVVLQHPSNRIVAPIQAPSVSILHQGWVNEDGSITIEETVSKFSCSSTPIPTYSLTSIRGAKSITQWVSQQAQARGFAWQGVVLKDGSGTRWRIRSQVYETVRQIRGNESTDEERFIRLRNSRTIEQYIALYPEDRERFYALEGRLRANTKQLFHFYGQVFRTKQRPFAELPWPYKHHVSVLHNLYKDTLRKEGKKITFEEVIHYVNGLTNEDLLNMTKEHSLIPKKQSTTDSSSISA